MSDDNMTTISAICRGRAVMYQYFAASLYGPPGSSYVEYAKKPLEVLKKFATETECNILQAASEDAIDFVSNFEGDILQELTREYTSLFYLGSQSVPITSSAYFSSENLNYSEVWEDVLEYYERFGFSKPKDFNEPEDHIAIELDFIHHLSKETEKAATESNQDKINNLLDSQKDFLVEYPSVLIGAIVEEIPEEYKEDSTFYLPLLTLIKEFMKNDAKIVNIMIDLTKET